MAEGNEDGGVLESSGTPPPGEPAGGGTPLDEETLPGPLPPAVRHRVLDLVAAALDSVPAKELPPSLLRVSQFAPRRRVKAAGEQIAAALEADDFRETVLRHVDPGSKATIEVLTRGTPPAAGDPVDVAALAFLARRRGWTSLVQAAAAEESSAAQQGETAKLTRANEQLEKRLAAAKDRLAEVEKAARTGEEQRTREIATLRNELREARRDLAAQQVEREKAERRAEEALRSLERRSHGEARELKAAQARVDSLVEEVARLRAAGREDVALMDVHARLLLDTLVEAATALRREWGSSPDERRPADFVSAGRDQAGLPAGRPVAPDDLLATLAMPNAHLIVDGYNVTKLAWPSSTLLDQRTRLVSGLGPVAAQTGAEITVVFDGVSGVKVGAPRAPRGVRVVFSRDGETADEVIRQLVAAEPTGRVVVVASSDQEVAAAARRPGHRAVASAALVSELFGHVS